LDNKKKKELIQRIALIIIFYLVFITLLNNTVVTKLKNKTKQNNQILNDLKTEYQVNLINSVSVVDMIEIINEKEEILNEYEKTLITELDKKYIIEKITEIAKKNNILIKSIDYSNEEDENFYHFKITMNINSNYENLVNFFNNLNIIKKKLTIDKCNIKRSEIGVETNVEIIGYMYKEIVVEKNENEDNEVDYYD